MQGHSPGTGSALRRVERPAPRGAHRRSMREICAGSMWVAPNRLLEDDSQATLERPVLIHLHRLVALGGEDLTQGCIAERRIRQVEPRRVRGIIGRGAEFKAKGLAELEFAKYRAVDAEEARAVQNVASYIADDVGRRIGECRGIEPVLAWPLVADNFDG